MKFKYSLCEKVKPLVIWPFYLFKQHLSLLQVSESLEAYASLLYQMSYVLCGIASEASRETTVNIFFNVIYLPQNQVQSCHEMFLEGTGLIGPNPVIFFCQFMQVLIPYVCSFFFTLRRMLKASISLHYVFREAELLFNISRVQFHWETLPQKIDK